jgi:hypothetical protein
LIPKNWHWALKFVVDRSVDPQYTSLVETYRRETAHQNSTVLKLSNDRRSGQQLYVYRISKYRDGKI